MEWQHWLDPVGQYTGVILAVKSQFVFGVRSVGFSLRRKLLDARRLEMQEASPSWGSVRGVEA
jgi:hypothetical protein